MTIDGRYRKNISPGIEVDIVLKKDQRTGKKTRGIVKDLLTNSQYHPHGIKVRLEDGQIGRVVTE
ncbi:YwbE family protein [Virgibacillus ndiopensis]|uniref:YwbE family protein n=1 Tax=Virgibacillus ndiopensis TaxID=2004408 RepID=UPI001145478D|nr:YwbE family protein [Virgibacillus ndiopensis]